MRKPTLIVTIKSWLSLQPENCNLEFQSQRFSFERCIDVVFFFNGYFNPSIYIYHTRVYQFSKNYIVNFKRYKNLLSVLRDNRDVIRSKRILAHHSLYISIIIQSSRPTIEIKLTPIYFHLILISNRPLSPPPCPLSLSHPFDPFKGSRFMQTASAVTLH